MHYPRKLRTRKFLHKLADLLALGLGHNDIAKELNEQFKMHMVGSSIKNIVKRESVLRKQIVQTDEEFKDLYKEILQKLVFRADANLKILEEIRIILLERFDELKKDMPESKLFSFMKGIEDSIKTQNDSIRAMNELLKTMQVETQEIKVSTAQSVQETVKILKDLERMNYITINPDYYKSELFQVTKEKDKKEEQEEKEVENEN